jgi:transglutaminase-like putative cysteine protease
MNTPTDGRLVSRIAATAALALYSATVAYGFVRVFSDRSFIGDLFTVVIVGHGLSLALRRVHLAIALPLQILAMIWLLCVLCHPDTMSMGLPTAETWEALGSDIRFARDEFRTAVAPVDYTDGWSTLSVIGTALAVLLSDVFAFRARTRFEALVPGGVLFVVVGALGAGRDQWVPAMLMVLSGVVAIAALRAHQVRPPRTLVGRSAPPLVRVAMGAVPLGIMAAGVAGALGPSLPGADSEAWYDPVSADVSRIGSPLVDIKSRLVNQSDEELFRVTASDDAYWRLTTLSEFDGRSWRLPEREVVEANDQLGLPPPGSEQIRQTIEIESLAGRLVPAAAEPIGARAIGGRGLRWSEDAATLLTDRDGYDRGATFEVVSAAPRFTPAQLAATEAINPPDDSYVELPDDLPELAVNLAEEVTAEASNDYERALSLQNYFRSRFQYSLDVKQGHGNRAMEDFLERRTGYCEQFAGTFAAMARHLGMPARVAVGYTPGTLDEEGQYSVAGRNAHAWPEVWFDGLGWVPFEPTPGRGAPGTEQYTGVRPDQAEPVPGGATTSTTLGEPTGTAPGQIPLPPVTDPRLPRGGSAGDGQPSSATSVPAVAGGSGGGSITTAVILFSVLAVIGLVVSLPALLRRRRRARWHHDPHTAVADIWVRVQHLIGSTGMGVDPSRTPTEFAVNAARAVPGASTEIRSLAGMVNRTLYGPPEGIRDDAGVVCEGWYNEIVRHTGMLLPVPQRIWRYITLRD